MANRTMAERSQQGLRRRPLGTEPPPSRTNVNIPFTPPEVTMAEIVLYQDGFYNQSNPGVPALVTAVGPRAVKLSIIGPDALNIRIIANDVRHKDDPENQRLAGTAAEAGEGYGVWWHVPGRLTVAEQADLKILLDAYRDEIDGMKAAQAEKRRAAAEAHREQLRKEGLLPEQDVDLIGEE